MIAFISEEFYSDVLIINKSFGLSKSFKTIQYFSKKKRGRAVYYLKKKSDIEKNSFVSAHDMGSSLS